MSILEKKEFYPPDVINAIDKIKLSNYYRIPGSFDLKSRKNWGDIDVFNIVTINDSIPNKLKKIIQFVLKTNDWYFMDCKLGIDYDVKIIDEGALFYNNKAYGYDYKKSVQKLEDVYKNKLITADEYKYMKKILVPNPNIKQFDLIMKNLRIHILRWTPDDLLKGYITLRSGKKLTIMEALKHNSLFKIDFVTTINGLFTELGIVYDIRNKDGSKINKFKYDLKKQLENDINRYMANEKYFNVLKRAFSLTAYKYRLKSSNKKKLKKKLETILHVLNGNLGILYKVLTMMDILIFVITENKNLDNDRVDYEINKMMSDLSNIYKFRISRVIIKELFNIISLKTNKNIANRLLKIYNSLENKLHKEAKKYLRK